MTGRNEGFTKSSFTSVSESNIYVPQQLIEANELLKSVNRRLEDCALEWQAEISRKQWKSFNCKAIGGSLSVHSILARTYFSEKRLDETFQRLLTYNKIFSEYLKIFIDLLQGESSNSTSDNTYVIQNHCNTQCEMLSNINVEPMHFNHISQSTLNNKYLSEIRKVPNYVNDILTVKNLFAAVVSAKDNFDRRFVEFQAVLHKITSVPTDAICFHRYWSNIMKNVSAKSRKFRNTAVNKRNRTVRKVTYLTRSSKLFKKDDPKKSSLLIDNIGGQLLFNGQTKLH